MKYTNLREKKSIVQRVMARIHILPFYASLCFSYISSNMHKRIGIYEEG